MHEINETCHITEEMWDMVQDDSIGQIEFLSILEHTCECTWCAQRLAHSMEAEDDIGQQPPIYLKEEVLKRSRQLNIQAAAKVKSTSRQVQLMVYSLKVGLAVIVSVFILGLTSNFQDIQFSQIERPKQMERQESVTDKMNGAVNGIADKISDFSNLILNGGK